jgi:GntP family gluconate:H+ symporter
MRSHDLISLLGVALAVAGLVVLVARFKFPSFIALALASFLAGLCGGMNPAAIASSFSTGVGNILGSIAMVIGLGAVLGRLLGESGAAEQIASSLLNAFGAKRAHWTVAIVAFIVGLPVFFGVGLVLLLPVVATVARQSSTPMLRLALPMVAGLSVVHGLVPPHPGPLAAVELLKADLGKTILYSLLIGLLTLVIIGPLLRLLVPPKESVELSRQANSSTSRQLTKNPPGLVLALFTILLPVFLMLLRTLADLTLAKGDVLGQWADFLGHPVAALLAAVLLSFWSFGYARGFTSRQLLTFSEESLVPLAAILLVVGAGGGFSQVLIDSGAGALVAKWASPAGVSPLLAWALAALIRVATGSATVAITTASGILGTLVAANPAVHREWLVIAMGAGSLILSHVNDGGFWMVKEYLGLSVTQTLKTWTLLETTISLVALALTLVFSRFL